MTLLRVLRWELYKLVRRPSSYIGFGLCVLFCAVVMLFFYYSQFRTVNRYASRVVPGGVGQYINCWFFATMALYTAYFSLLPLIAAVIPGSQFAGEAKDGTLRLLLTRPVSRPAVFAAKLIVTYLWIQLIVLFLIALAIAVGWLALGGGDYLVFLWEYRRQGPWFADSGDIVWIFLATGFGAGLALMVIASFSLMLSVVFDNPVVAYITTLGAFFCSSLVQRLPPDMVHPDFARLMPTTYIHWWHELFQRFHPTQWRFDADRFWSDIQWSGAMIAVFLTIAFVAFCRRDIKS